MYVKDEGGLDASEMKVRLGSVFGKNRGGWAKSRVQVVSVCCVEVTADVAGFSCCCRGHMNVLSWWPVKPSCLDLGIAWQLVECSSVWCGIILYRR